MMLNNLPKVTGSYESTLAGFGPQPRGQTQALNRSIILFPMDFSTYFLWLVQEHSWKTEKDGAVQVGSNVSSVANYFYTLTTTVT